MYSDFLELAGVSWELASILFERPNAYTFDKDNLLSGSGGYTIARNRQDVLTYKMVQIK
ncbi:MAG: hypothetical protein B193_2403 [Solidesulfovibrio magneticus str. Maddingley MBC34]|uniref:Uncharacterized protein n=1 Tax=Solidesulfovibrio magneticus str. Maddingley MBC34 TaxID=1206767 RepID=K6FJZ8_9BACT|nr:MAG: hypothetical protein B193_2403 [Solidesulfovibrio magneticus str. Maddingley MBC34]